MDPLTLTSELLRAALLAAAGALWAVSITPRGCDPVQRWRVQLASAALAAMVAGAALFYVQPAQLVVWTVSLSALIVTADLDGLARLYADPERT